MSSRRYVPSPGLTSDAALTVHDLGGDGPNLLLAHATGFHGLVWAPCAAQLTGYRCWAPDLRGHGDSPAPAGDPDEALPWDGFADDLLAVIDGLALNNPGGLLAAGHSKGAAALLLAEQRRPGTFRALYLFEPIVFPPDLRTMDNPLATGALRRRADFGSFDEAYTNFSTKPPLDTLHPDALRAYVDHGFVPKPDGTVTLKCRPEIEAAVYRGGMIHDAFSHLAEVNCPVTVAAGADEPWSPSSLASLIADGLPHGELVRHPSVGHFGPLEAPGLIADDINRAFS